MSRFSDTRQDTIWECHTYLTVASKIILKTGTVAQELQTWDLEILWVVMVGWNGPNVVSCLLDNTILE